MNTSQRSSRAVLVSVHRRPTGKIRLVFGWVEAESDVFPQRLRSTFFITHNDYSEDD